MNVKTFDKYLDSYAKENIQEANQQALAQICHKKVI